MNYYETLEVSQSATQEEIKTSFRKLAFKYHPDRNGEDTAAEQKFKEVNEAYQALSNPRGREQYDSNTESMDMSDFANLVNEMYNRPLMNQVNGVVRLTLAKMILGSVETVKITVPQAIHDGKRIITQHLEAEITLNIPAGFQPGMILRTEIEMNGSTKLLSIGVDVSLDEGYRLLNGGNVATILNVTYPQSILGVSLEVGNLLGEKKTLKVPPYTKPGSLISIKGEGLPMSPKNNARGALLFSVNVMFPDQVDEETKNLLTQLQGKLEQQTSK